MAGSAANRAGKSVAFFQKTSGSFAVRTPVPLSDSSVELRDGSRMIARVILFGACLCLLATTPGTIVRYPEGRGAVTEFSATRSCQRANFARNADEIGQDLPDTIPVQPF